MILVFDTETTGIPDFKKRSDDPSQPHIVEIAWALVSTLDWSVRVEFSTLIRPDGWTIPDETSAIHGITTERALADGKPIAEVLEAFGLAAQLASHTVAYNGNFDRRMIRIELLRSGYSRESIEVNEAALPIIDPCRVATALVALPPSDKMAARGMRRPKPPKLIEAYAHFFGEPFAGAHGALADVRATVRLTAHLARLGHLSFEAAP